jgi:hypothetical protein
MSSPAKSTEKLELFNFALCVRNFLFMNPSLRLAPRKLLGLAQSLRCLQQIRTATHLRREELARALDDQIRAKFPRSSAAEVEAVVEARREIWGGTSGGVYVTPIGAGMTEKLTS